VANDRAFIERVRPEYFSKRPLDERFVELFVIVMLMEHGEMIVRSYSGFE
jgi:hypothetical protein